MAIDGRTLPRHPDMVYPLDHFVRQPRLKSMDKLMRPRRQSGGRSNGTFRVGSERKSTRDCAGQQSAPGEMGAVA